MLNAMIAGLVGTAIMTLFMYAMTFLTDKVMKVVKILGTMLTLQTTHGHLSDRPSAMVVGTVAHSMVGVGFALVYHALWQMGVGSPTLLNGAILGLISGVIGILVWRIFFALHPDPPVTVPLSSYLFTLLVAHLVFGVSVALSYQWLSEL